MVRSSFSIPVLLLAAFGLALLVLWPLTAPLPQDPAYHNFADRRAWLGVPNFGDVISNAALLIAGLWGLLVVRRTGPNLATVAERRFYALFFLAIVLTALGSAYYHLEPTSPRLFWDRLPLALALGSIPVLLIVERTRVDRAGLSALAIWLALGPLSVVYWRLSEQAGQGDLRPYALVQVFAVIAPLLLLALLRSPYSHARWYFYAFGCYLLSKPAEHWDAAVFALTGFLVSGHTLKHVAVGAAAAALAYMLKRRVGSERRRGIAAEGHGHDIAESQ